MYKLIILLTILTCKGYSKKYDNYTLYRGIPVTDKHLAFFNDLDEFEVNFWRLPGHLHKPVDFVVPPDKKQEFLQQALLNGVYLNTVLKNIQSVFDQENVKTYVRRKMETFNWNNYFRFDDIKAWLQDLTNIYPNIMKIESIGRTYEGRDILVAKIRHKGSTKRSVVIVEGGIHAREWISIAFVTYFLKQILTAPSTGDEYLQKISKMYEWYFVPILNPDGYEYSHTTDRLFRKNRRFVDINRNFGVSFGSVGVSQKNSSEIYCGAAAFSESESTAMANLMRAKSDRLKYYLAFHSYGQYIIIPYAFSKKHEENYDELENIGIEAAKRISKKFGTEYEVGTAYDTVGYLVSGVSGCWAKKVLNVPYVLTFELRDKGKYGFALPPNQILPTCEETMDGLKFILLHERQKLFDENYEDFKTFSGGVSLNFDIFVFVWNFFLFLIVRFD